MRQVEIDTLKELNKRFTEGTRDNGEKFWFMSDNGNEFFTDFIRKVHGTDMLPDDFRYSTIVLLVDIFLDQEDIDLSEISDSLVDVYTHNLTKWLSSNVLRTFYIDEVLEEGYKGDFPNLMMQSQFREINELANRLLNELSKLEEGLVG